MSQHTHRIHWLGAGLSSGPGIRRLAASGRELILWNRTVEKATAALEGCTNSNSKTEVRAFTLDAFQKSLSARDIVVSMLPATMHTDIAELCLAKGAHLVTTSYISPAMQSYHESAKEKGLCLVNECGLDPGIDHVFAHKLVAEYRASSAYSLDNQLSFKSYCGGFPKVAGDFKYKFSWSPLGVLRALTNQAKFIKTGHTATVTRAWEAVTPLTINNETFEVYPNRDSLPYVSEYGFNPSWRIQEFVRGTIRLGGWSNAWEHIFTKIQTSTPEQLESLSQTLWNEHAYQSGEEDRVVLYVSLQAKNNAGQVLWEKSYSLDECGTGKNTAMAKLVSLPATYAVEAIEQGSTEAGVSGAPHSEQEATRWLRELSRENLAIKTTN